MAEKLIRFTVPTAIMKDTGRLRDTEYNDSTLRLPVALMELLDRKARGLASTYKAGGYTSDGVLHPEMDKRSEKGEHYHARVRVRDLAKDMLDRVSEREEPHEVGNWRSDKIKIWRINLDYLRQRCYQDIAHPALLEPESDGGIIDDLPPSKWDPVH